LPASLTVTQQSDLGFLKNKVAWTKKTLPENPKLLWGAKWGPMLQMQMLLSFSSIGKSCRWGNGEHQKAQRVFLRTAILFLLEDVNTGGMKNQTSALI